MTRSDELMLAAIRMKSQLSINGREVTVNGENVTIWLYGVPTVVVRFGKGDIRINGMIKVSRKSAKVLNAILKTYTDCSVKGMGKCWVLERNDGEIVPLGENLATIPMTKSEITKNEIEDYIEY